MNETNIAPTPPRNKEPRLSEIAACWSGKLGGPALTLCSFGLTIGLAVTGLVVMGVSAVTWLFSGADWFCGLGLLTGGMFLASATALCLGQMSRTGDALYRNLRQKKALKTT